MKLNKNILVKALGKPANEFTKDDIIRYIVDNDIEMVNFMYPAGDGRLKTLNFVINDLEYLETILTAGERVDGSSLFSFLDAGNSDLYVIPRFSTAFVDPFAQAPTLSMLCTYFDKNGSPLAASPEMTLRKACEDFHCVTGLDFYAMGELEYYVITPEEDAFPAVDQRGYHESAPFAKLNDFRCLCMKYIAQAGGQIKYGHSEVGNFVLGGKNWEQNEIEFLPVYAPDAADQLMIAKWIIRNLAYKMNLDVTFAPKITPGKAGSGLHIHIKLMRDGHNVMLNAERKLSDDARRLIAGMITLAPSLTAFGNAIPTSYFRLVPHQEAPTNICWGDCNRSVLIRVPLGWSNEKDMCRIVNPHSAESKTDASQRQTVEIRSGDCSANVYYYMAALAVAARLGFEMPDALEIAKATYADVNIHRPENAAKLLSLKALPTSCVDSAKALESQRKYYEADGIFPKAFIDSTIEQLTAYNDTDLCPRATADPKLMAQVIEQYFYCG